MLKITVTTVEDSGLCPVRNVLANVTGKWSSLVLFSLEDGPLRFSEIKRTMGDVTQRVLTENLRSLERDGYVTRSVRPGPPVEVSYALTNMGVELVKLLMPLALWAEQRFDVVMRKRKIYDSQIK
jgi:DNA-binding HxlR family transcriptional regulator